MLQKDRKDRKVKFHITKRKKTILASRIADDLLLSSPACGFGINTLRFRNTNKYKITKILWRTDNG